MSAERIVRDAYEAYGRGDLESALKDCAPGVQFRWPVDQELCSLSGTCQGRDAFLAKLSELHSEYEYNRFSPISIVAAGERVAAQVEFELTHRRTGRKVTLENAHFWTVRDGRIVELVEYFDTALVQATMNKTA